VPRPLDGATLRRAARDLASRDPVLGRLHAAQGTPPLWARQPSFGSLVHIILEQQVSLGSARAAHDRLRAACGGRVTPAALARLDDATLRAIGFSRQKAGYARDLALAVGTGRLPLSALTGTPDQAVRDALMAQRGIGPWTADIYLVMALRRPDVWPRGDLALRASIRDAWRLAGSPDDDEAATMADAWRPWRSVAARMLWQGYLVSRSRPLR
jgi:DNA-3-methyladenine glycosylase II